MAPDTEKKLRILGDYVQLATIQYGHNLMMVVPDGGITMQLADVKVDNCLIINPNVFIDARNNDLFKQLLESIVAELWHIEGLKEEYEKTINKDRTDVDFYANNIFREATSKYNHLIILLQGFDNYCTCVQERDYNSLMSVQGHNNNIHYVFTVSAEPRLASAKGRNFLHSFRYFNAKDLQKYVQNVPNVFHISYCHKDVDLMSMIKEELFLRGYSCITDEKLGNYDELEGFMIEIGNCENAIMIISDTYLKRPNCMFELTQFLNSRNEKARFLPVIFKDPNADIFNDEVQDSYYKFWKDKAELKDGVIADFDPDYKIKKLFDDKEKYIAYIHTAERLFKIVEKYKVSVFGTGYDENEINAFGDSIDRRLGLPIREEKRIKSSIDTSLSALEGSETPVK